MSGEIADIKQLFSDDDDDLVESAADEQKEITPEAAPGEFKLVSRGQGPLRERYRPQRFEELAPTCSITQLRNLIDNPNASKVFLFEGKTGTGKTTSAKLVAKASVCLNDNTLNKPCLECSSCLEFENNFEVTEINVADQRKIDDVRKLVEMMRYRPGLGGCSKKIFILDEAHQYTPEAQQVLLTQLENPPPYLLVFMCTTDAHTMNPMLVDRGAKVTFRSLTAKMAAQIVNQVCANEGINPSDEIKESFYHRSKGSVRSLLNKIQAFIEGGYDIDGSDDEELEQDVQDIARAIVSADYPDLVVALRKPNVRKIPDELCLKLTSYFRGAVLAVNRNDKSVPANEYKDAIRFANVLVRLLGDLEGTHPTAKYNAFVARCMRALNVMKSK